MIGDVLVSSIICNNLRKAYPNAQIDYLVYESTKAVLEGNKNISNIISFTQEHRENRKALLQLAMKIRAEKYDILIDAYSKLESWIITALSGAKRKISYKKPGRTILYTDNVPFAALPKSNLGWACRCSVHGNYQPRRAKQGRAQLGETDRTADNTIGQAEKKDR